MKKTLKKFIGLILSFVIICSGAFVISGCSDRSELLRIYVPGEYIDDPILHGSVEDEIEGFENWYKERTGKNITVVKKEFDTNETMYTMIATKRQDFDIICPSDYMVERLISENLLLKVNSDIMSEIQQNVMGSPEYIGDGNGNSDFVNLIKNSFDPNLEYAAPYMWGTMGIMYYYNGELDYQFTEDENGDLISTDETELEDIYNQISLSDSNKSSWQNLFNVNDKKIYMKDSERDSYTVALFNAYYEQLKELSKDEAGNPLTNFENDEYQKLLNSIFIKGSDEEFESKLKYAKETLLNQKKYVYDYESDEGKDDLLTSKGAQGYYGAFWSCDAGYIMADFSGEEVVYNENFRYVVPSEGSNVWVDSFCIPKYAGNKNAAELFMLYMSDPEVAFNCMDYAGCTSAIYDATVDYYNYLYPLVLQNGGSIEDIDEETEYDDIFCACSDSFKSMYLSLMFPHLDFEIGHYKISSPLKRCGIMRDLGSQASDKLLEMWTNLRRWTPA